MSEPVEELNKPYFRIVLEALRDDGEFFNLIVNGNKTVQDRLIAIMAKISSRAYAEGLASAVEDFRNQFRERFEIHIPKDLEDGRNEEEHPLGAETPEVAGESTQAGEESQSEAPSSGSSGAIREVRENSEVSTSGRDISEDHVQSPPQGTKQTVSGG